MLGCEVCQQSNVSEKLFQESLSTRLNAPALELKRTPLNAAHRQLGGRMVEFGGWDMPVQYSAGTVSEHLRTRIHAGLFDVSHMGEIDVRGPDAIPFVNRLVSNDAARLPSAMRRSCNGHSDAPRISPASHAVGFGGARPSPLGNSTRPR